MKIQSMEIQRKNSAKTRSINKRQEIETFYAIFQGTNFPHRFASVYRKVDERYKNEVDRKTMKPSTADCRSNRRRACFCHTEQLLLVCKIFQILPPSFYTRRFDVLRLRNFFILKIWIVETFRSPKHSHNGSLILPDPNIKIHRHRRQNISNIKEI